MRSTKNELRGFPALGNIRIDALAASSHSSQRAQELLQILLANSSPRERNAPAFRRLQDNFKTLERESDSGVFENSLLHLGIQLKNNREEDKAHIIFGYLLASKVSEKVQRCAREELQALEGRGSGGRRVEFLLSRLTAEATGYRGILPMLAGSVVGQVAKGWALSRLALVPQAGLLTRGFGAKLLAGGIGMSLEVPTFALSERVLRSGDFGEGKTVGQDLAGSAFTLGALKLFGVLGTRLPFQSVASPVFSFLGLLAANQVQMHLGLKPKTEDSIALSDGLAALFSMSIGAHLGQRLLGPGWVKFQAELEMRAQHPVPGESMFPEQAPTANEKLVSMKRKAKNRKEQEKTSLIEAIRNPLLYPLWLSMGTGGVGGGGGGKNPKEAQIIQREQLWESMKKDPDNRELRQVYGDLLQEMGDPRGEFISLQMQRPEGKRPNKREIGLEKKFIQEISQRYSLKRNASRFQFENGFLKGIFLHGAKENTIRKLLVDRKEPFLRGLSLRRPSTSLLESFSKIPQLRKLSGLSIYGINSLGVGKLVRSQHLTNLSMLGLSQVIGDDGAMALAAPPFSNLTGLSLPYNKMTDEGLMVLTLGVLPVFSNLQCLILDGNQIGDDGIKFLAEFLQPNLTDLYLSFNQIGVESSIALAGSPKFPNLRKLDLGSNRIEDEGVRALAASPYLKLTHLNLSSNQISADGIIALASSPSFSNLQVLEIAGNNIGDEGARALAASPYLLNLTHLHLGDISLEDSTLGALVYSPYLQKLESLRLNYDHIDPRPLRQEQARKFFSSNDNSDPIKAIAAPSLIGLDWLLNGHLTTLGVTVTAVSLLPFAYSAMKHFLPREGLGKLGDFIRDAALSPLWMFLGAGGPGGSGGFPKGSDGADLFQQLKGRLKSLSRSVEWHQKAGVQNGVAAASHRGIAYDLRNEDRYFFSKHPEGQTLMVAIDGLGGHANGEVAAELVRSVFAAKSAQIPLPEIMNLAHQTVLAYNREFHPPSEKNEYGRLNPGAVAASVEIHPKGDGNFRGHFWTVGDAESVVLRISPEDGSVKVIHYTTRPTGDRFERKNNGEPFTTIEDGRLALDDLFEHRQLYFHPVDSYLGQNVDPGLHHQEADLQKGDIVLVGSDGFFENFGSYEDIGKIIATRGATTSLQVLKALFQETLVRMALLEIAKNQVLNHELYRKAYRMAFGDEPPPGWRGFYEPLAGDDGTLKNFYVFYRGILDHATGKVVDVLKQDNLTLLVQVLGEPEKPEEATKLKPSLSRAFGKVKKFVREMALSPMWMFLGAGGAGGGEGGEGDRRAPKKNPAIDDEFQSLMKLARDDCSMKKRRKAALKRLSIMVWEPSRTMEIMLLFEEMRYSESDDHLRHQAALALFKRLHFLEKEERRPFVLRAKAKLDRNARDNWWSLNLITDNLGCLDPEERVKYLSDWVAELGRQRSQKRKLHKVVSELEEAERLQFYDELEKRLNDPAPTVRTEALEITGELVLGGAKDTSRFIPYLFNALIDPNISSSHLLRRALVRDGFRAGGSRPKELVPHWLAGQLTLSDYFYDFQKLRVQDQVEFLLEIGKILVKSQRKEEIEKARELLTLFLGSSYPKKLFSTLEKRLAQRLSHDSEEDRTAITELFFEIPAFQESPTLAENMLNTLESVTDSGAKKTAGRVLFTLMDRKNMGKVQWENAARVMAKILEEEEDADTVRPAVEILFSILVRFPEMSKVLGYFQHALSHPNYRVRDYAVLLSIIIMPHLFAAHRPDLFLAVEKRLDDPDLVVRKHAKDALIELMKFVSQEDQNRMREKMARP